MKKVTNNYKELLVDINTFIFDYDGVLTDGSVLVFDQDKQPRTVNVKDGYGIQYALKMGYNVAIISGGTCDSIHARSSLLGIKDIFIGVHNKEKVYTQYKKEKNIEDKNIIYVGDDIPDYPVMKQVGVAVCPADAAIEIKEISDYISIKDGGKGCARDIIEQVLRVQSKWFTQNAFEW